MEFIDNVNLTIFRERYLISRSSSASSSSGSSSSRRSVLAYDAKNNSQHDPIGVQLRRFLTDSADPLSLTTISLKPREKKTSFMWKNKEGEKKRVEVTDFAKREIKTYFPIDACYNWLRFIIDIVLTPVQKDVYTRKSNGKDEVKTQILLPRSDEIIKRDHLNEFLKLFSELVDGEPWLVFRNRLEELRFSYRFGISPVERSINDNTSSLLDGCYHAKDGFNKRLFKYFTSSLVAEYGLLAKHSRVVDSKEMIKHILQFDRSLDGVVPLFERNHQYHTGRTMKRSGADDSLESDASYVLFNFDDTTGIYIRDDEKLKVGEIGEFTKQGSGRETVRFCKPFGELTKESDLLSLGYEQHIESDRCLTRFRGESNRLRSIVESTIIKRLE